MRDFVISTGETEIAPGLSENRRRFVNSTFHRLPIVEATLWPGGIADWVNGDPVGALLMSKLFPALLGHPVAPAYRRSARRAEHG
jgi:hypothetical protein